MIEQLRGIVVGVDTAPFIYFIERHRDYHSLLHTFFTALDEGQFAAVTSTITLAEVLVHPFRRNKNNLVRQYRDILLGAEHLSTLTVTPAVATRAAQLRAAHNLRTPDALQLATALLGGATFFLTNDMALRAFPHLTVILVNDFAPT